MKKTFENVRIIIFSFLVILAMFMAVPVRKSLVAQADSMVQKASMYVKTEYGIELSYSSLSPSILSTLYVHQISVKKIDTQETILFLDKTKLTFRLLKLLKGNFQEGFTSVVIDGITIDFDHLILLFNTEFNGKSENASGHKKIQLNKISSKIPQNIRVKNITINYEEKNIDADLLLHEISIKNNSSKENIIFQMDSKLKARFKPGNKKITCGVNLSGTIQNNFENCLVNLRVRDIDLFDYKLNKLNMVLTYSDRVLDIQTIQAVNPIGLTAVFDFKKQNGSLSLKADKLKPTNFISSLPNQRKLKKLKDFYFDLDSNIFMNLDEKSVTYDFDAGLKIPSELFSGGADLRLNFTGDQNHINIQDFSCKGEKIDGDLSLLFDFKNFTASGLFELPYFVLQNGKVISTEMYFDPLDKGFMLFSPQLIFGERLLTALQLNVLPEKESYDFMFEVYDYSHVENSEPSLISMNGSFLTDSRYLQANLGLNSIYLDSIALLAGELLDEKSSKSIQNLKNTLSQYVFSGDAYFSTNFDSLTFNIPYILLANTKAQNQFLMASLNGNENSYQLDNLELILGKYAFNAQAFIDKNPEKSDYFFSADFTAGSVPYHFMGNIMKDFINITGDYDTSFQMNINKNGQLSGAVQTSLFPINVLKTPVIFSTDAVFSYDNETGPLVQVERFELEAAGALFNSNPRFVTQASITKYGVQLNQTSYLDIYSSLDGSADISFDFANGIFNSVQLNGSMKNPYSSEEILIQGSASNPESVVLDMDTIKKDLYFNLEILINRFGLNRFAVIKNDENLLTASVYASGTLENPMFNLIVDDLNIMLADSFLKANSSVSYEDGNLSIHKLDLDYGDSLFRDISVDFSVKKYTGSLNGVYESFTSDKNLYVPFSLEIKDAQKAKKSFYPERFVCELVSPGIGGSLMKKELPLSVTFIYSPEQISVFSSANIGLKGTILNNGLLDFKMNALDNNFRMNAKGNLKGKDKFLRITDIYGDCKNVFSYTNFDDWVIFDNGILTGSINITGNFNYPKVTGALQLTKPVMRVPIIIPNQLSQDVVVATIYDEELRIPRTSFKIKNKNELTGELHMYFNKWSFDRLEAIFENPDSNLVPLVLNIPAITVGGDVNGRVELYYDKSRIFDITGGIFIENVKITSGLSNISNVNNAVETRSKPNYCRVKLDIDTGTHISLNFNPLLRTVLAPKTKLLLMVDQEAESYSVDGDIKIRSGDISYLNRNFYIKSGNIKFNPSDIANPILTLKAETRERDDKNQNIRIILDVENQKLLELNPRFSAIPAKSEREINEILGQIITGDASSAANFIFAASDYAIQSTVVREAENTLRELFNFDIFSLRTNVIQNTLNMGVSGNLGRENLSIGNFLDNSTVYIGKYLGSSIYVDAMLQVSFEDGNTNDLSSAGAVIFQPEFGFELESPILNIRWSMAPDINALLNKQYVPSSAITLSWKHAF